MVAALGAKLCGPVGFLLGSTQVAPALVVHESPSASTSPILAAGWHTWRNCARAAGGRVMFGRATGRLARRIGLIEAVQRLNRATRASALAASCARGLLFILSWPWRRMRDAAEPEG